MATFATDNVFVTALDLPDDVVEFAQAMAGEKAVDVSADRRLIMEECACEIEKAAGQLFWYDSGVNARRSTSVFDLTVFPVTLDACPLYPNTHGGDVDLVSVESWDEKTAAWITFAADRYTRRPFGRIRIPRDAIAVSRESLCSLRIIADTFPPDPAPKEAVEALARLFALRENRRPGSGQGGLDADGRILNLDNAMRRSGAREVLDSLRTSWPV